MKKTPKISKPVAVFNHYATKLQNQTLLNLVQIVQFLACYLHPVHAEVIGRVLVHTTF